MGDNLFFDPDWISPPGDTIASILDERGLTRGDLARSLRLTHDAVNELIRGDKNITDQLCEALVSTLGATARFWKRREARYRDGLAKLHREASSPEVISWYKGLPTVEMSDLGWISPSLGKVSDVIACLRFFGVPNPESWQHTYKSLKTIAFRTSKALTSDPTAVIAWLRQGELLASEIACSAWDPEKFRDELIQIRTLTRLKDPRTFMPELVKRCASCGVAVVLLRSPTQCKASGAVKVMSCGTRMLLLSGRYGSDDHFWFTFYHEAGHLVLHQDRLVVVDELEGDDNSTADKEEKEANDFAESLLIPIEHQAAMRRLKVSKIEVMRFAKRIGIARGIVVGQLQHLGLLRRDYLNGLKTRFRWVKDEDSSSEGHKCSWRFLPVAE